MPSRRTSEKCERCGKKTYRSVEHAIHAIVRCVTLGSPPLRWYTCPHDPHALHITKLKKIYGTPQAI